MEAQEVVETLNGDVRRLLALRNLAQHLVHSVRAGRQEHTPDRLRIAEVALCRWESQLALARDRKKGHEKELCALRIKSKRGSVCRSTLHE